MLYFVCLTSNILRDFFHRVASFSRLPPHRPPPTPQLPSRGTKCFRFGLVLIIKEKSDHYLGTQLLGYKENPTVLDRVPMSTEGKLSRIQWGWF